MAQSTCVRRTKIIRALVTGFGAFPGAPSNPTLAIIAGIARSRRLALLDVEITARALPVVYAGAEARLAAALAEVQPDVIVHLGFAARRKTLSVETRARNRLYPIRMDAARQLPEATHTLAGAPGLIASRWPSARVLAAMAATGAPTRLSIDAGDYVCNQILFLTLAGSGAPAGFIHVPKPRPRAPSRRIGARRDLPTLGQMVRAVEAALLALAIEARNKARLSAPCGSNKSNDD